MIPSLTGLWGLAALRAVQALCFAASGPAQQALVADLIGSRASGAGYGFYALAGGLGQAAGPMLGGWLYDVVSPAVPFYVNGVVLALCAIAAAMWLWALPNGGRCGGVSGSGLGIVVILTALEPARCSDDTLLVAERCGE